MRHPQIIQLHLKAICLCVKSTSFLNVFKVMLTCPLVFVLFSFRGQKSWTGLAQPIHLGQQGSQAGPAKPLQPGQPGQPSPMRPAKPQTKPPLVHLAPSLVHYWSDRFCITILIDLWIPYWFSWRLFRIPFSGLDVVWTCHRCWTLFILCS